MRWRTAVELAELALGALVGLVVLQVRARAAYVRGFADGIEARASAVPPAAGP